MPYSLLPSCGLLCHSLPLPGAIQIGLSCRRHRQPLRHHDVGEQQGTRAPGRWTTFLLPSQGSPIRLRAFRSSKAASPGGDILPMHWLSREHSNASGLTVYACLLTVWSRVWGDRLKLRNMGGRPALDCRAQCAGHPDRRVAGIISPTGAQRTVSGKSPPKRVALCGRQPPNTLTGDVEQADHGSLGLVPGPGRLARGKQLGFTSLSFEVVGGLPRKIGEPELSRPDDESFRSLIIDVPDFVQREGMRGVVDGP